MSSSVASWTHREGIHSSSNSAGRSPCRRASSTSRTEASTATVESITGGSSAPPPTSQAECSPIRSLPGEVAAYGRLPERRLTAAGGSLCRDGKAFYPPYFTSGNAGSDSPPPPPPSTGSQPLLQRLVEGAFVPGGASDRREGGCLGARCRLGKPQRLQRHRRAGDLQPQRGEHGPLRDSL